MSRESLPGWLTAILMVLWAISIVIVVGFGALCILVVVDFVIDYVFQVSILDHIRSWFSSVDSRINNNAF